MVKYWGWEGGVSIREILVLQLNHRQNKLESTPSTQSHHHWWVGAVLRAELCPVADLHGCGLQCACRHPSILLCPASFRRIVKTF